MLGFMALIAIVKAQATYNKTTGEYSCAKQDAAYCAGASLGLASLFAALDLLASRGNCDDNLDGEFPVGLSSSECYQTSPTSGDAACAKNCIVYGDTSSFSLSGCIPSTTQSSLSTAPPTVAAGSSISTAVSSKPSTHSTTSGSPTVISTSSVSSPSNPNTSSTTLASSTSSFTTTSSSSSSAIAGSSQEMATNGAPNGPSTGAKIGISLAIAFFTAILLGIILFLRRWRRSNIPKTARLHIDADIHGLQLKPELEARDLQYIESGNSAPVELQDKSPLTTTKIVELPTRPFSRVFVKPEVDAFDAGRTLEQPGPENRPQLPVAEQDTSHAEPKANEYSSINTSEEPVATAKPAQEILSASAPAFTASLPRHQFDSIYYNFSLNLSYYYIPPVSTHRVW